MVRHRKHRRSRQGWSGAVLAVFVFVLATVGLLLAQLVHGGGPAAATSPGASSPALVSSTSPVDPAQGSVPPQTVDRGTVGETVHMRTAVKPGGWPWAASLPPSSPPWSTPVADATAGGPAATAAPVAPPTAATPGTATEPTSADPASQVVALTNAERAKAGCAALTVDSRLTTAAQAHSDDMATHNYFSHTSQDGRTPFQRMAAAGYQFSIAAENIAAGQRTPTEVMVGWMNSSGHRENILNCSLKQIGVGYGTGGSYGTYWTQDFGTP
ncbi:CAP domain-containing protein [Frankia sp. Cas3]|uniref:CAP domain-containing protein n=1 Tax=Frankia sp. Cas3 TaxID=3073926 RepID=UPI002AD56BAE|nr:CAP domain-containing protein [Frankia sp. Cas3]